MYQRSPRLPNNKRRPRQAQQPPKNQRRPRQAPHPLDNQRSPWPVHRPRPPHLSSVGRSSSRPTTPNALNLARRMFTNCIARLRRDRQCSCRDRQPFSATTWMESWKRSRHSPSRRVQTACSHSRSSGTGQIVKKLVLARPLRSARECVLVAVGHPHVGGFGTTRLSFDLWPDRGGEADVERREIRSVGRWRREQAALSDQ